jgi:tRNA(Ile)-lysidine synthase
VTINTDKSVFMTPFFKNKINELFTKFFAHPTVKSNKIAVAVSGGADSLSLCLLLNEWAKKNNKEIIALTVDHKLRKDSTDEALKVKEWLLKYNIKHTILTWSHDGIESRLQEQARTARYDLMTDYCKHEGIDILTTAHHLEDQLETFLMRLSKGSGPDGLCGIRPYKEWNDVLIVRPLLSVLPDELKSYLNEISQMYITDPSNDNKQFERVRWRDVGHHLIENGLSTEHFLKSIDRLNDLNQWVEESLEDSRLDIVNYEEGVCSLNITELLQLNITLSARLLCRIMQEVSGKPYPSSYDKAKEIILNLTKDGDIKYSAGSCVLSRKKNKLIVTLDPRV